MTAQATPLRSQDVPSSSAESRRGKRWTPRLDQAVALCGLVALAVDATPIALLAVLWGLSPLLNQGTRLRGLMLAPLVLYGLAAAVLTVLAVLAVPADVRVFLGFTLAGLLCMSTQRREHSPFAERIDTYGAAAGFLVFMIFYRPHLGASGSQSLGIISSTTDAGSHLHMIRHVLEEAAYLTLRQNLGEGVSDEYPPAFAGVLGVLLRPVLSSQPDPQQLVSAVILLVVLLYAVLAWVTVFLTLRVLSSGTWSEWAQGVAAVAVSANFVLGPLTLFLRSAAYAQLVAVAMVLACVVVASESTPSRRSISMLTAMTIGAAQSWYLLAPLLVIPWLSLFLRVPAMRVITAVHALIAAPFCLFPVMNGPDTREQLQADGFLLLPDQWATAAFLSVTVIALVAMRREQLTLNQAGRLVSYSVAVCAALVGGVAVYQLLADGGFSYYFGKLLYIALTLSSVLAGVLAAVLARASGPTARATTWLFCVLVPLSPPIAFLATTPDHVLPLVGSDSGNRESVEALSSFFARHPKGMTDERDVYILMPCARQREFHVNRLIYDLSTSFSDERADTVFQLRLVGVDRVSLLNRRAHDTAIDVLHMGGCGEPEPLGLDDDVRVSRVDIAQP